MACSVTPQTGSALVVDEYGAMRAVTYESSSVGRQRVDRASSLRAAHAMHRRQRAGAGGRDSVSQETAVNARFQDAASVSNGSLT